MKKADETLKRKPGSGSHNRKQSASFMEVLEAKVAEDPATSQVTLAKEFQTSRRTLQFALKDLGLQSYVRHRRQLLTDSTKAARVTRGKQVLTWLRHNGGTVKIFSDKKTWRVGQTKNRQNDRYLAYCVEEVPGINTTKHPAGAMMLSSHGSTKSTLVRSLSSSKTPHQPTKPKKHKNSFGRISPTSGPCPCGRPQAQMLILWIMAFGVLWRPRPVPLLAALELT